MEKSTTTELYERLRSRFTAGLTEKDKPKTPVPQTMEPTDTLKDEAEDFACQDGECKSKKGEESGMKPVPDKALATEGKKGTCGKCSLPADKCICQPGFPATDAAPAVESKIVETATHPLYLCECGRTFRNDKPQCPHCSSARVELVAA